MRPGQDHEYGVGQVATCLEQGGIGSNYDTGHNSLLKVPPTSAVLVFLAFSEPLVHSIKDVAECSQTVERSDSRYTDISIYMILNETG